MRERTILLGAAVAAALLIVAAASGAARPRAVHAGVQLRPDGGSGARGVAFFRQQGRTLSGWVAVWGLTPGSRHAVHFHGPAGKCAGPAKAPVAAHRDVTADKNGVGFVKFRTTSAIQVIRKGFYYNVHARSSADGSSPQIVCAELRPAP